jgi:predicted  nucleic acid-binding Zn-ribbon protein
MQGGKMKKALVTLMGLGSVLFAQTGLERRVTLLENAVSILIDKNKELTDEINNLKKVTKINSQMITSNRNELNINKEKIKKLEKEGFNTLVIIKAKSLNVRKKPSLKADIVRKLKRNEVVKVYDTVVNENKVWYKIIDGYISARYTNLVIRRKK